MSVKMKFGSKDIPFVYKGDKLVYPNPIKDGLLLWYDFKGMRNTDTNKEVAKDLSGNGNDGALTNFNFTEESGYKDNTLVFDGVDDSLTIPELVLDETAMSAMQDGKLYAYEDDKVVTVGDDGEIVGGGKNLIINSDFKNGGSNGWSTIYGAQTIDNGIYKKTFTESVGAARLERIFKSLKKGIYTLSMRVKFPTITYWSGFINANLISSSISIEANPDEFSVITRTFEVMEDDVDTIIRAYVRETGFEQTYEIDWFKIEKGYSTNSDYIPHPSDYKTTTLTPASLTDLQLYSKTLSKDELLRNAESKGLKKLKPGVVVQDGLVLHYDFSHESNTSEYKGKAFDYSGNGNHGVLNNFNFTEESGYEGEGLKFDGVDDGITSKSGSKWENQSKITVEVALKSFNTSNITVVSNDYRNFEIAIQSGGGIQAYYSNGSGQNYKQPAAAASLNDGNIHFVTVVFHKDESLVIFYEDGKEIHRYQEPTILDLSGQIPADFCVGQRPPNGTRKFPGVIYSTKIYNRPLTSEEIAHNYAVEKERFGIADDDNSLPVGKAIIGKTNKVGGDR